MVKRIKQKTQEIISTSSIHGLPKLITTDQWFLKFCWFILLSGSLSYSIYIINCNMVEYFEYPVFTNVKRVYENQPQFPTVTFCYADSEDFYSYSDSYCIFNDVACPVSSFEKKNPDCIRFNAGKNLTEHPVELLNVTKTGDLYGLYLNLIPIDRYVIIYINNQSINIDDKKQIKVYQGSDMYISLSKVVRTRLAYPHSNCKKDYTFVLGPYDHDNRTSYPYIQTECYRLCKYRKILEACNRSEVFSSYEKYYFTNRVYFYELFERDECKDERSAAVEEEFNEIGENKICEKTCPAECESVSYMISSFSNFYPKGYYSKIFIYYDDFHYTLMEEQAKVTAENLFGSIGGVLGLFLGISVINFFEVSDLVLSILIIIFEYLNKRKKFYFISYKFGKHIRSNGIYNKRK